MCARHLTLVFTPNCPPISASKCSIIVSLFEALSATTLRTYGTSVHHCCSAEDTFAYLLFNAELPKAFDNRVGKDLSCVAFYKSVKGVSSLHAISNAGLLYEV